MSNRSGTVKNVECTNYTYITNYITPSPYYEQFNRSGTVKNVEYNNKIRRLYRGISSRDKTKTTRFEHPWTYTFGRKEGSQSVVWETSNCRRGRPIVTKNGRISREDPWRKGRERHEKGSLIKVYGLNDRVVFKKQEPLVSLLCRGSN